jgi:hypothetical protein
MGRAGFIFRRQSSMTCNNPTAAHPPATERRRRRWRRRRRERERERERERDAMFEVAANTKRVLDSTVGKEEVCRRSERCAVEWVVGGKRRFGEVGPTS